MTRAGVCVEEASSKMQGVPGEVKVKLGLYGPLGLQEVETRRIFRQSAHEGSKVVCPTHRPPLPPSPPGKIRGHFCYRLSLFQGYRAAGRIKLMKSLKYPIWIRTRDLRACSPWPQLRYWYPLHLVAGLRNFLIRKFVKVPTGV